MYNGTQCIAFFVMQYNGILIVIASSIMQHFLLFPPGHSLQTFTVLNFKVTQGVIALALCPQRNVKKVFY